MSKIEAQEKQRLQTLWEMKVVGTKFKNSNMENEMARAPIKGEKVD